VNILLEASLVTKINFKRLNQANILKIKKWAMQDLNLQLFLSVEGNNQRKIPEYRAVHILVAIFSCIFLLYIFMDF